MKPRHLLNNLFCCLTIATLVTATTTMGEEKKSSEAPPAEAGFVPLFDGKSLEGWTGDEAVFRVENESIVGGQLQERIDHNYFLSYKKEYSDFELRLQFRLKGDGTNAGIQIRSERIPNHHEMIGYQADLGQKYWGALYDESRRRKILAGPNLAELNRVLKKDDWNDYRIRCHGPRIQLWINELKTVDYVEPDDTIPATGRIALQIHGGPPGEAWYRHIRIQDLTTADKQTPSEK